jgi:hypothetical protein
LFDPAAHERLTDRAWNSDDARRAVAAIVADAESAFDPDTLWPAHLSDLDEGPLPAVTSLYLGASGVIWALGELGRDWTQVAAGLHERYMAAPDFAEEAGGPVPSYWMGEAGILLLAHRLAPARWQEERLLDCVRDNATNPTRELMWGSPGTMLAAAAMYKRTGGEEWADAWRESADWLWQQWDEPVWEQDLYGQRVRYLGPAHGFAGNVHALAHGDLLDAARRAELEQRAVAVVLDQAQREGDIAQWPPLADAPATSGGVRTQWCHGAPGIVTSLASIATQDDRLTEVLVAGGELTWRAGPHAKGPGLCHGTAGNGYAFLKLFERTQDELWLDRARAFAMHAAEQVEQARSEHGRGRYTLWTGDLGTAIYLWNCVTEKAELPTLG